MRVRCLLPSRPGLFKGDPILLDKCQELIRRTCMDMIAVLTGVIIDLLGTQLQHKLDLSTSFRGDGQEQLIKYKIEGIVTVDRKRDNNNKRSVVKLNI
jgi:hypothetical protein